MEITRVDPSDETALGSWYEAYHAGRVAGRERPNELGLPELAVLLRTGHAYRSDAYLARDGARVLGGALVMLPLLDNRWVMDFDISVPPEHRRQGIGSALYEHLLGVAKAEGRTSLLVEVIEPYQGEGPAQGRRFAEQRGFRCVNREVHRVLDLPLAPGTLDGLARHAARRQDGYRLRTWTGACPDDLVDGYVALHARFLDETPTGDMDYEPEHWDADRLRADERKDADQGRTVYTTVAVAPDGALVGHTVLKLPGHDTRPVYQADTLVLPGHRGHRLGLGLKVANLRAVTEAHPERRKVHTFNATDNGPMVAVNDAMGFRGVELAGAYQLALPSAPALYAG